MSTTTGFESFFIEEPELIFGENKRYVDPKLGLWAHGPCLLPSRKLSSLIRLAIIGSGETVDLARRWIEKLQDEIMPRTDQFPLFPAFPGFGRVFGSRLHVLDECIEIITEREIRKVIELSDFGRRLREAASLFTDRISNLAVREPRPHVAICALPQVIINRCGSRVAVASARHLSKEADQTSIERFMYDDYSFDLSGASDLRRLIKAKSMPIGIATQLVKPRTFNADPESKGVQDEATRAMNFCVALYYKAEGYPWKLAELTQGACYVGVTFYKELSGENMRTSMAQVFTHTGEGLVLRGGRAIRDIVTKATHLPYEGAYTLMSDAIDLYNKQMHQLPTRLVVHKSSRFWPEEISGFKEAATKIRTVDLVAIDDRGIRFTRETGQYPPLRGTVVQIGKGDYILFTKGYVPLLGTYPGHRVPAPLEIVEHQGDTPIHIISKEILSLSKMNWNSADFCVREPITLAYSREVGKILAYVPEEVIPRPEYRYYM